MNPNWDIRVGTNSDRLRSKFVMATPAGATSVRRYLGEECAMSVLQDVGDELGQLYGTIYWGFNVHPIYQLFWARKQGFQNFAIYTHVIPRTMNQYLTNMGIETPRILI